MSTQVIGPKTDVMQACLLRDLLILYVTHQDRTENVLEYLASVEDAEMNPWVKDDIRIAWLTVLYAARGYKEPHVSASYMILGLHPNKAWTAILARREALLAQDRKKKPETVKLKAKEASA